MDVVCAIKLVKVQNTAAVVLAQSKVLYTAILSVRLSVSVTPVH